MAKDISRLLKGAFRPRSTLVAWMRENHDAFHARISTHVPDWPAIAAAFAEEGLTNRLGKPPQAEATRKLWRQVHREVMASRSVSAAPVVSPEGQGSPPRADPASEDEDFFRPITKTSKGTEN